MIPKEDSRGLWSSCQLPSVVVLVPWMVLASVLPTSPGAAPSPPRHIVMIILEDVSRSVFEKGDPASRPTRALDDWAKANAVTFRHAYANAAVCNPSRAAIFTCKLPEHTGVFSNADDWRSHGSVIEYLKNERAYQTVRVDKVFHKSKFPHPPSWSEIIDGRWPKPSIPPERVINDGHVSGTKLAFGSSGLTGAEDADFARAREAIRVIREFDESRGDRLFLAVGLKSTHLPFRYPADYRRHLPAAAGDERSAIAAAYANCLEYELDCALQVLRAAQERFGENLVSVVVSDHGFALGEKGLWRKPHTIDETTRVPLFISAPGLDAGSRVTGPFELARLMPTVLDLAGVPPYPEAFYASSVADIRAGRMPAGTLAITYAGLPTWKVVRNDRFALHHWNGSDRLTDLTDGDVFSPTTEEALRQSFAR